MAVSSRAALITPVQGSGAAPDRMTPPDRAVLARVATARVGTALAAACLCVLAWAAAAGAQATAPHAPVITVTRGGPGELVVAWTRPDDGGSAITKYELRGSQDGGNTWGPPTDVGGDPSLFLSYRVTLPGLTIRTTYTLQVRAINSVGDGGWSAGVAGTPAALPGTPTVTVSLGSTGRQIDASWTAVDDGGAPVTYSVEVSRGGVVVVTSQLTGTAVIFSRYLRVGAEHSVRVQAVNEVGAGAWSAPATITPVAMPLFARSIMVEPGDGELRVRWSAATSAAASWVVRHRKPDAPAWTSSDRIGKTTFEHTITGLTNGDAYDVQVGAVNDDDDVSWGKAVRGTPVGGPTVPAAPPLALRAADAILQVAWIKPDDGGSPITAYELLYKRGARAFETAFFPATSINHNFTGVKNGETYSVLIRAINRVGAGPWSAEESVYLEPTVPHAPVIYVRPGNGRIDVSWLVSNDGGSPITGYDAQLCARGRCVIGLSDGPGSAYFETFYSGNPQHWVRVRVRNAIGDGPWTNQHVTRSTPYPPAPLIVTPGDGQLTVGWTLTANDNGRAVTAYRVYLDGVERAVVLVSDLADPDNPSHTITGLNNGEPYAVQVAAVNSAGLGGLTARTYYTPYAAPDPPGQVRVETGAAARTLDVTWSRPYDGGDAITGYELRYRRVLNGAVGDWNRNTVSVAASETRHTLQGLLDGGHQVQVAARNRAGAGAWSDASSTAVVIFVPYAPTNVSLQGGDVLGALEVSWSPPPSDGGKPIRQYQVRHTADGGNTWSEPIDTASTGTRFTLTGLTNFVTHGVQVRAESAAGAGGWSRTASSTVGTSPGAPRRVSVATRDSGELVVTWEAPLGFDASLIGTYRLRYSADGGATWSNPPDTHSAETSYTLTGLDDGAVYRVQVKAVNPYGSSSSWSPSVEGVPVGPPGVPSVALAYGDAEITVEWTAVDDDGGSPLTGYDMRWRPRPTQDWTNGADEFNPRRSAYSHTITGLINDTDYEVQVRAFNAVHSGDWSATQIETPSRYATLTALSAATGDDAALRLTPAFSSARERYTVKPDGAVDTVKVTATAAGSAAELLGILTRVDGTTETVAMTSGSAVTLSDLAKGDTALAITVIAPDRSTKTYTLTVQRYTRPGAVAFTATADARGRIQVEWTAPEDTGGLPVTGYRVDWGAGGLHQSVDGNDSAARSHTITGLADDTEYQVLVRARNALWLRGTDGRMTVTTRADGAPTAVIAGGATREVAVNVDATLDGSGSTDPDNLGLTYEWTALDATDADVTQTVFRAGAGSAMATFRAPAAGTYTVTLTVTDAGGDESSATVTLTDDGSGLAAPSAPTGVTVRRNGKDGELEVEWSAPADDGGVAVASYRLRYTTDDGVTYSEPVDTGNTETRYTFAGLVNGTAHSVEVRAVNAVGPGNWSAGVAGTPATLPGIPAVTAAPGANSGEIEVSWTPPADGGAAIASYTLEVSTGGAVVRTIRNVTGSARKLTGLVTDAEYSVRVQAVNAVGAGEWSAAAAARTPLLAMSVKTVAGDGRLTVQWSAPDMAVVLYQVQHRPLGNLTWSPSADVSGTTFSHPVTGLTNGRPYKVRVGAVNDAGDVFWSALANGTPRGAPAAPPMAVLGGNASVAVDWDAPADNGRAILGYTLQYKAGAGAWKELPAIDAGATGHTLTGLNNGTRYTVRLRAFNSIGAGRWSEEQSTVLAATVPARPEFTAVYAVPWGEGYQVRVQWRRPNDGGSPITQYHLQFCESIDACNDTYPGADATYSSWSAGVDPGQLWFVRLRAHNALGQSGLAVGGVNVGAPRSPVVTVTHGGSGELVATWTEPADHGSAIQSYWVYLDHDNVAIVNAANARRYTFTGLINGRSYAVQVGARNRRGTELSNPVYAVPAGKPLAPAGVSVASGVDSLTATWLPADGNGLPVTGYQVRQRLANLPWSHPRGPDGPALSYTIPNLSRIGNLPSGGTYAVQVRSVTAAGFSDWSDSATGTVISAPTAPSIRTVRGGHASGAADLSWSAPVDHGGRAIMQYQVRYKVRRTTSWSAPVGTASTGTSYRLTGLTDGTDYDVQVRAQSAVGNSPWSTPLGVAVGIVPEPPLGVAVSPGKSGELVVAWWPPTNLDESLLTQYKVHYKVKDGVGFKTRNTKGPVTTHTITGLENGVVHEVKVSARTNVDEGNFSAPVEGVPVGPPSAPEVTLTPAAWTALVAWTPPVDDGGSPITGYDLRWRERSTTTWVDVPGLAADASPYNLTGLGATTVYEVEVRAFNAVHAGAYSTAVAATTRLAKSDATLSALSATDADGRALHLEPSPFAATTYDYFAVVDDAYAVDVTATTNDFNATLVGDLLTADHGHSPVSMTSGTAATVAGLATGDNLLTIVVTAEDGFRQETYKLRITRAVPPTVMIRPTGDDFETTGGPARASLVYGVQVDAELPLDGTAWDPDGGDVTYLWTARIAGTDVTSDVFPVVDQPLATFLAATPGDYTVTLVVTDDEGQTATDSVRVRVTDEVPNDAPTVELEAGEPESGEGGPGRSPRRSPRRAPVSCGSTYCIEVNTDLRLSAHATDDGSIVSYGWWASTNGGRNNVTHDVLSATDTAVVVFNAAAPGEYAVGVHVFDDDNASTSARVTITVRPPDASSDATLSALSAGRKDIPPLTIAPSPFSATTYAYATAVGEQISWLMVTATVNDRHASLSGSLARVDGSTPMPVAMTSGKESMLWGLGPGDNVLTITVTAQDGTTQDYTLTLTREAPPTAVIDPSEARSVKVGADLTLDGSGSTDPDGGAIVAYIWEALDSRLRNVTVAAFGSADVFGPTATFNAATAGDYTVWLTVVDDEGDSSYSLLSVEVLPEYVVTGVATRVVSGDPTTADRVEARVTFAEPVTVDTSAGEPTLGIALGGERREAAYESGSGTAVLVFVLEVAHGDPDAASAQVIANGLKLNGSTIQGPGGVDAGLAFGAAPAVSAVAIAEDPDGDGIWYPGDAVEVTFTFTEPVVVNASADGTPVATLVLGGHSSRQAPYARGSGTDTLVFSYTVNEIDWAATWVTVQADGLIPHGDGIRSTAGLAADLAHPKAEIRNESLTVGPRLSVGDATIVEEAGAPPLEFVVFLSEEATEPVTVEYETVDGTAVGGQDYVSKQGRLFFAVGETRKTVQVMVLDDLEDEGMETLTLVLSNPTYAGIQDGEGLGTILNTDPMPAAWLARFGRTVAEQALDGVSRRMKAPRGAGFQGRLGGQGLTGGSAGGAAGAGAPGDAAAEWSWAGGDALRGHDAGWGYDAVWGIETAPGLDASAAGSAARTEPLTVRELLRGSSFTLTGTKDAHGGSLAFWGRGAQTRFDGREDALDLDGTVTSGMLGADYSRGRWMVGLALTHGSGDGGYAGRSGAPPQESGSGSMAGEVESSLTAAVPYATWRISDRLRVWGAAGYGAGGMTLTPSGGAAMKTDVSWNMAAVGMRGELIAPPGGRAGGAGADGGAGGAGPALALISDALWARTSSDRTSGLVAVDSDVTRFRVGLEGSWTVALAGGGRLVPRLELGARHDGGDADTGAGVDLGGGIVWSDPALGLSLDVEGRTLIASEADGHKDRGFAAGLAYDPDKGTKRGPSFSLRQDWGGKAKGGIDALFAADPLSERGDAAASQRRWEAEAAYGFAAFGGRFTASPHAGVGLSASARDYSLGWKVTPEGRAALALSFGVKATLRESAGAEPEYRAGFELTARW